ncbi:MAG: hypothetical protein H6607_13445 [Flavobacteriales bacterium]|nr:hypothetical protein [Flavobacteriales bacterium]
MKNRFKSGLSFVIALLLLFQLAAPFFRVKNYSETTPYTETEINFELDENSDFSSGNTFSSFYFFESSCSNFHRENIETKAALRFSNANLFNKQLPLYLKYHALKLHC